MANYPQKTVEFTPFEVLFDKVFTQTFPQLSKEIGVQPFQQSAYPKCDIINFSDRIEILAEVPGLTKDQIVIDIDSDVITIKGKKQAVVEKDGGEYLRRELKRSNFQRSFTADSKIFDLDNVSAKFVDGLLELTVPKHEPKEPTKRSVEIK